MSKNEKIGIFLTIIYFVLNLLIILSSSAILAHLGMRLKHAVIFALFYCSWQELYIMLKAFFKELFNRECDLMENAKDENN